MRLSLPDLLLTMPHRTAEQGALPIVEADGIATHVVPDVPYVWPDVIVSPDTPVVPSAMLLVTAPGAMGKSAAAKNMASRLGTVYIDLASLRVGSSSLTGELTKALGFNAVGDFVRDLKDGTASLILDSTDEAQLKAGRDNYLAFLNDLLWLLVDAAPANQVALLGRRDSMETTLLALMDLGSAPPLYHIEPLSEEQASDLIDLTLDNRPSESGPYVIHRQHREPFARLRNSLFRDLAEALDPSLRGLESYWNAVADFLGYPPVLIALSERLAVDNPSAEVAAVAGRSDRALRGELLKNVVEQILDREQGKVQDRLGDAIGMRVASGERHVLYARDEQVSRLLARVGTQGITLDVPATLDEHDRATYEENIESFVMDHPFLKDDKFTSVVFQDYVRAWAIASEISDLYSTDRPQFLATLPAAGPFFAHFVHALSVNEQGAGSLPEEMVNDAIHSFALGEENGNAYYMHQAETAFLFLDSRPAQAEGTPELTFAITELSGAVAIRGPVSRLTFVSTYGLLLVGNEGHLDLGPNVAIVVNDLEIQARSVTAFAQSQTEEKFFNMITATNVTHDPDLRVNAIPRDSLSIAWSNPWYQWKEWSFELERANPRLSQMTVSQILLCMRRIFTSLRSNMQDDPSVSADKMDRLLIRDNVVFKATLAALHDLSIITRSGTLYKVDLETLATYGVSWRDLYGDDPVQSLRNLLRAVVGTGSFSEFKE